MPDVVGFRVSVDQEKSGTLSSRDSRDGDGGRGACRNGEGFERFKVAGSDTVGRHDDGFVQLVDELVYVRSLRRYGEVQAERPCREGYVKGRSSIERDTVYMDFVTVLELQIDVQRLAIDVGRAALSNDWHRL